MTDDPRRCALIYNGLSGNRCCSLTYAQAVEAAGPAITPEQRSQIAAQYATCTKAVECANPPPPAFAANMYARVAAERFN
jgi:hypothetical protein